MKNLSRIFRELVQYPSAAAGLVIIAALLIVSLYTVITLPYNEAVRLWRGGEDIWQDYPKNAEPEWMNLFRREKLPKTMILSSQDSGVEKSTQFIAEGMDDLTYSLSFEYPYDGFPQEIAIYFTTQFVDEPPHISLSWLTPDGREIRLGEFPAQEAYTYRLSQDERLLRRLGGVSAERGLFADPAAGEAAAALKGRYELRVSAILFDDASTVDAKMILYGQVHGIAGTDHRRRDLLIALMWGTPVALSFGLLAALGTTLSTMIISAISVWFGGWVDNLIQRVTEVNLILPLLPILIMIGTFYSRQIWVMLGVVVVFNIFGAAVKTYRAVFLQVKEAPFIEAARAYGASQWRIIFLYMIPRILPMLIPQLVVLIPGFVFLEATLAVLGLGDPVLPTWGKIINDARSNGVPYQGYYYWVLEPSLLLMLTGLAFSMVGFALDRIFNPRLRGV